MISTRIIAFTLLLLSLGIASCAAYFSISGLSELFAAAVIPVVIMTSTLEAAKLGATFYVHRWWDILPAWKWLIAIMIAILMAITSMGIFGFLSKGHLDQEAPLTDNKLQIERLDERSLIFQGQIDRQQAKIEYATASIKKLDGIIDTLIKYDRIRGKDGADATLKSQSSQREEFESNITKANDEIEKIRTKLDVINKERITIRTASAKIEAKLGPIIYAAELFGFDLEHGDGKGKAVRLLIIMLMIAFDPLAIVLIMAFDWTLQRATFEKKEKLEADLKKLEKELQDEMVEETTSTEQSKSPTPSLEIQENYHDGKEEEQANVTPVKDEEKRERELQSTDGSGNGIRIQENTPIIEKTVQDKKTPVTSIPMILVQLLNDDSMTDEKLVQHIRSNKELFDELLQLRDVSSSASDEDREIVSDLLSKVEELALIELTEQAKPKHPKPDNNAWLTGLSGRKK